MPKFIGVRDNRIKIVSDTEFQNPEYKIFCLPIEFDRIANSEIIENYKLKDEKIVLKNQSKKVKDLRIAFVSNWGMQCGISTYFENLLFKLKPHLGDYKLFTEYNESSLETQNIQQSSIPKEKIIPCWSRGDSLLKLISEIKKYDPDIVLIQHEFGIWPNARYWLSLMNQLNSFRVITVMHSVFYHQDKTICEAAMPEIIVHLDGAKKVLKSIKKVPGNVSVIPHGCYAIENSQKLWNYYKSDHTVIQMGFGFPYKNFQASINAISFLKQKYPDIFFTGIFSESQFNKIGHQNYYDELMELVDKLSLQESVSIIRGFQSDETLDSYLRTNQVAIFPYISNPLHEVWGASGAARFAMSKNLPVITSSINHFSDLPTIKANTPEEIATELDKLFSNRQEIEKQLKIQQKFIEENSWEVTAQKYINIFES